MESRECAFYAAEVSDNFPLYSLCIFPLLPTQIYFKKGKQIEVPWTSQFLFNDYIAILCTTGWWTDTSGFQNDT